MKKLFPIGLMSALLLSSIGVAANAQSFYFNNGYHRFFNDNDGYHRSFYDRDRDSDRINAGWGWGWRHQRINNLSLERQRAFDNRVAELRRQINFRAARGEISPERATALAERINNIVTRESQMSADGMLTGGELSMLEARLNNVQFAMRGGWRFY